MVRVSAGGSARTLSDDKVFYQHIAESRFSGNCLIRTAAYYGRSFCLDGELPYKFIINLALRALVIFALYQDIA